MISIVCVVNDDQIFNVNLLKSLKTQDTKYELIVVKNHNKEFSTLTSALNHGGHQASGDYILFIHQDAVIDGRAWLKQVEETVAKIKNLGIAGVTGVTVDGTYRGFIVDRGKFWGSPIKNPIAVQTLDEVLLIIPASLFKQLPFDEQFGYHSYGADYCLSVKAKGFEVYVIPGVIRHNSLTLSSLNAGSLTVDDLKLLSKHKISPIFKTTGKISIKQKNRQTNKKSQALSPKNSQNGLLPKFLVGAKLVADVGVVPREQVGLKPFLENVYSIGISSYLPNLLVSKRLGVHDDLVLASVAYAPFKPGCIDVGLMVGTIEYMSHSRALNCISQVEKFSKKTLFITPNNGFSTSRAFTVFSSYWTVEMIRELGYDIYGLDVSKVRFLRLIADAGSAGSLFVKLFRTIFSSKVLAVKDKQSLDY